MTAVQKRYWSLQVTFCDQEKNGFVTLGGAAWENEAEWQAAWNGIQEAAGGWDNPDCLCVDKLDPDGDIIMERPITAKTAEILLRKPIDALIAEGRANTCFTMAQEDKSREALAQII